MTAIPTEMNYDDFADHETIERVYARELQDHLKKLSGAHHVRVIDYVVRVDSTLSGAFPYYLKERAQ